MQSNLLDSNCTDEVNERERERGNEVEAKKKRHNFETSLAPSIAMRTQDTRVIDGAPRVREGIEMATIVALVSCFIRRRQIDWRGKMGVFTWLLCIVVTNHWK